MGATLFVGVEDTSVTGPLLGMKKPCAAGDGAATGSGAAGTTLCVSVAVVAASAGRLSSRSFCAARADDSQKNTPKPTLASNVAAAAMGVFCVGLATTGRLTITTSLIFLSHDRRSPLPGVRPIAR